MNIQALAAKATAIGMKLAGSPDEGGAKELVTFHLGAAGSGEYDPATDKMIGGTQVDAPLEVLTFKRTNLQDALLQVNTRDTSKTTETLLVQAADLPPGMEILEENTVTRADGQTWAIVKVEEPPGKAIFLVDVRK